MGAHPEVGDLLTLQVAAVAHGGHCVARHDGVVVFVRHALPEERVRARVTEVRRAYLRADVVEVLEAATDRVTPGCPYAHPDGCGGCDLQHVSRPGQLRWKTAVVTEQLARLGGLSTEELSRLALQVRPLPEPPGDSGWRTRVRYAVDSDGRAGLRAHRSHQVVPVRRCAIAAPAIQRLPVTGQRWPDADEVEVTLDAAGQVAVRAVRDGRPQPVRGPDRLRERAVGRVWSLPPGVFWQVHPAAADVLAAAVLELAAPAAGHRAWDLYGGAGLFAAALAGPGQAREVTLVESSGAAAAAARDNLGDLPAVSVLTSRVDIALRRRRLPAPVDLVVLDPPRAGAGAEVVRAIAAATGKVAYVACDPAAFARDVAAFRRLGWSLRAVRAFDCFPHTHHVECVGLLTAP